MKRDLVGFTVLAALCFLLLIGLGTWQVQRLEWKESLVARIEARAEAPPASLADALARWNAAGDAEYVRVRMQGRFHHGKERHLYHVKDGTAGWRIVTPFETESGRFVLADRGFVPHRLKPPSRREAGQVEGAMTVTGLVRAPGSKAWFTPDNRPAQNEWYWRDLIGMAASVLNGTQRETLVPFFVELEAAPVPGGWPKGGVTRLRLRNNHLQYAVTWYSLAAILAAIYAVYMRGRLRRRESA